MGEKLFFSKLVTKDLTAINSTRRLFEGVLTVEMKDRQGEITIRDELLKVLPIWIARGGPITDTHSNRVVGQGINFGSTTITDSDGKSYPAITIQGEIFKDYELDDEIWKAITTGKYKGLSFGGATKSNRVPIVQKDGSIAYSLKDLEQYEVAVCEEPAVPLALITQHNSIAKAMAGNVVDRGDGKMCIRCDKFKCYIEKGDDTFSDVRGPNKPKEDPDAEALENNRGEPQENGATYHGTDKGLTYKDPNPKELNPDKIIENAVESGKKPYLKADDDKAMDKDDKEMLEDADLEEIEKVRDTLDEPEYGETNAAGEKVNRFGRKIPGVMSKKPSDKEVKDKPNSRFSGKPSTMGKPTDRSSPNMSPESLARRASGNWNKPSGNKVGGKKVEPRATVTHDHKAGTTTIDSSTARRGAQGKLTMPTQNYINNFTKSLDVLLLLAKFKFKPLTPDSRRENIQETKVPGTVGNQNKLEQEADHINTGKKIKPIGSDAVLSEADADALKTDYNTCEVVREYTDDDDEKNKSQQSAPYTEQPHGGNAGREPGVTRDSESQSTLHPMNEPVNEKEAAALERKKKFGDRAMEANNAEDGINGKMRLDDDEPAEALEKQQNDKVYDGKDRPGQVTRPNATTQDEDGDYSTKFSPGTGAGGVRVGAAYDNAQQGTGQKDDPREVEEENYTGEEDRGPEKYTGEEDTVSGASNANYNKSVMELIKLNLDLKTLK